MSDIDISGYQVTDDFFGAPFIDKDEVLEEPTKHRYVHGGFEGTDTRFAFRYPVDDSFVARSAGDATRPVTTVHPAGHRDGRRHGPWRGPRSSPHEPYVRGGTHAPRRRPTRTP